MPTQALPIGVFDTMSPLCQSDEKPMPRRPDAGIKRPRISIDVRPELRRRLRVAAARRDVNLSRYVVDAIEDRLRQDLGDELDGLLALNAAADPVLAELWDNPRDAAYERLRAR